jgi:hypothetical protein
MLTVSAPPDASPTNPHSTMKKTLLVMTAVAVVALVVLKIAKREEGQDAVPVSSGLPSASQAVQPVAAEPVAAGRSEPTDLAAGAASPSSGGAAAPAVAQAAGPIPEPSEHLKALVAELRPKVDAALRASDFQAADRYVDEVLATADLQPLERQRLMVVKMASRGMRGDHAAMLALMDEIIAVAPDSPLSAQMRKERPQLEKIQRLGPNHPELCGTCGQMHAPGAHPTDKAATDPPQD